MIETWLNRCNDQCRNKWMEFIRFAIVGSISAIVHLIFHLSVLWILDVEWNTNGDIGWRPNVAYAIGYIISLSCNLYLTGKFTFKKSITKKRLILFVSAHVCNFIIHEGLLNIYLLIGVANWLALPLVLIIAVPINFIMVRTAFKR